MIVGYNEKLEEKLGLFHDKKGDVAEPGNERRKPVVTQASFGFYLDCGERKLARIYTETETIPLNLMLEEGSDLTLDTGDLCEADIWSNEYEDLWFSSPEEWGPGTAENPPRSLIPSGTFAADFAEDPNWEEHFIQNETILFTGSVIEAERIEKPGADDPKWRLLIESFELSFWLYYYGDTPIEPGYVVDGVAWLRGTLKRAGDKLSE